MPLLGVLNLSKIYIRGQTTTPVLRDVSFSASAGDFCALTGASGSGKTTLMNLIGLLDRQTTGEIEIAGQKTSLLSADAAARLRNRMIGFVFQSFHLLPCYTALDNVALPLVYRGVSKRMRRELAAAALHQVGLGNRMAHRPDELSGGQRQRVAIARALVGNPKLLLADEPTGNLDSQSADDVMSLFLALNAELGLTVIIVTHDPTIAARCPRRIVMRDGQVLDDSSAALRSVTTT
ncbi:ABC transporter ATP-binding protein [Agrobacterium sp. NPDC089420]|uniref:ABC transporter ATP-binding protein n=1 Tax=Agrobacterium sp. NPDC089420 TaxID=3363918 RepID=UPI00384F615D